MDKNIVKSISHSYRLIENELEALCLAHKLFRDFIGLVDGFDLDMASIIRCVYTTEKSFNYLNEQVLKNVDDILKDNPKIGKEEALHQAIEEISDANNDIFGKEPCANFEEWEKDMRNVAKTQEEETD